MLTVALIAPISASAEVLLYHPDGSPAWIQGELGHVALPEAPEEPSDAYYQEAFAGISESLELALQEHFGTHGVERLQFESMSTGQLQEVNVGNLLFSQTMSGLPVVGGGFRARIDLDAGQILAIHGRVYPWSEEYQLETLEQLSFEDALLHALEELEAEADEIGDPELVFAGGQENLVLAYRVLTTLSTSADRAPEFLLVSATDGHFIASEPTRHTAPSPGPGGTTQPGGWWPNWTWTQVIASWSSRSIDPAPPNGWLPPKLLCSTKLHLPIGALAQPLSPCSQDDSVARAHENAFKIFTFFRQEQGWDSYDGQGSPLVSYANELAQPFQNGPWLPMANAYWNTLTNEMHYGDGDGQKFFDLTLGYDVAAHEVSHGISQTRNGLQYFKESGALNEAFSDIFAAAAEAWRDGGITNNTFLLGEDVAGPTLGQALRFMHNPSLDGKSPDFYPDRLWKDPCTPTKQNDWCGVHNNSGIANLAFYLLVSGGQHPQGKTTVVVPGIGMDKAFDIFFEAHGMLTPTSDFQTLRVATEQAAANLFDAATADAVSKCWSAVGVDP